MSVPYFWHRHVKAKWKTKAESYKAQADRLLAALNAEVREHNEDVLRLQHELNIALDGNRRLVDCLVRNRLEIP